MLAIANGSTDLITGVLAALNTEEGDEGEQQGIYLAIGGLVGSAVINLTIVTGLLVFVNEIGKVKVLKDQFIKDSSFLCFVALISLLYIALQEVALSMAILLLGIYIV